jgi:hypothetical protein
MRVENRGKKKDLLPREDGSFEVGRHTVRLLVLERRWSASVDGGAPSPWCDSRADAWSVGVREADRLDRPALSLVAEASTG